MAVDYQQLVLPYRSPAQCGDARGTRRPVVVVGAGPVGLTLAIDLARYGTPVLLLDDDDKLSTGSRAICFAQRTLEIWDRLGCGDAIAERGVSWRVGKVHCGDRLVYAFDLLPEEGHRRPAFVNLQQYYVEGLLYDHARLQPNLEMRFRHKVVGVDPSPNDIRIDIDTPDGRYELRCDYIVACDGSRSPLREMLGLTTRGQTFRDRFLIADIRMDADLPIERRFWFDPPFHPHGSALMHRQPDSVWRIDFQLGWDADPIAERQPQRVNERLRRMLGDDARFELVWCSVYTFSCMRMDRFRHARVIFAGDAAHGVSPFGARGANSGVQDADNLAWKLHFVVHGDAPDRLLDSYASEREQAADENIAHSSRSADFLTPKSDMSRVFRDAVLDLAATHPFARRLVNSGRLSTATTLVDSPLSTADADAFAGAMVPGAAAVDAPVSVDGKPDWLLRHVGGRFVALQFCDRADGHPALAAREPNVDERHAIRLPHIDPLLVAAPSSPAARQPHALVDTDGLLSARYDARPGTTYLLRPDQHVCARWRRYDAAALSTAVARATCNE